MIYFSNCALVKYDTMHVMVFFSQQLQGAETEFSSLTKLSHPNIVHYICMNLKEREDSIVVDILVEHISGFSLSTYLHKETPVPIEQLRHYVSQILSALDYLHNNSVVHKVLCASSILVDAEGNVKVTDYSISKRLADICKADVFEQTKVRFSEDSLPSKPGKKGDVWSLGLLLLSLSQGQVTKEYPVAVPNNLPAEFQDFLEKYVFAAFLYLFLFDLFFFFFFEDLIFVSKEQSNPSVTSQRFREEAFSL